MGSPLSFERMERGPSTRWNRTAGSVCILPRSFLRSHAEGADVCVINYSMQIVYFISGGRKREEVEKLDRKDSLLKWTARGNNIIPSCHHSMLYLFNLPPYETGAVDVYLPGPHSFDAHHVHFFFVIPACKYKARRVSTIFA